jgi:hypothetical protein
MEDRGRSDHKLGSLGGSNDADSCESSGEQLDDRNAPYPRFFFRPLLSHIDGVL